MKCEFEEKQYEQLLNIELAERRRIFPAGQVFEGDIGIDAALYSKNVKFWELWFDRGHFPFWPRTKSGVRLRPELWEKLKDTLDSDLFPKFKCNLFIQHKRPEFISSPLGKEYVRWNTSYYRYDITGHQQEILCKLERKVSRDAIVVYACGAFHTRAELWHHLENRVLLDHSNFVRPLRVSRHTRYTFVFGGTEGMGFSEPEKIGSLNLLREINTRVERPSEYNKNSDFIIALSRRIAAVVSELPERVRKIYSPMTKFAAIPEHELGRSIAIILAFVFFTGLSWTIIGD